MYNTYTWRQDNIHKYPIFTDIYCTDICKMLHAVSLEVKYFDLSETLIHYKLPYDTILAKIGVVYNSLVI